MSQHIQEVVQPDVSAQSTTAAIYLRAIGPRYQSEERIWLQRQQCIAMADELHLTIAASLCFMDRGANASRRVSRRPGFAAALESAFNKGYTVLLVPSITTISGDPASLLQTWDLLTAAGVSLIAIKERIDSCTLAGRQIRLQLLQTIDPANSIEHRSRRNAVSDLLLSSSKSSMINAPLNSDDSLEQPNVIFCQS